jgi:2-deoxy-D-gluconate 3-dehydrogenase
MKLIDLTGRVAIVTGGNGGIGLGMATGLLNAGASVVIAGRNKEKSAKAAASLGERARAIEVDVADEESVHSLVDQTVKAFGRVDILINNAGIAIRKQPEAYTLNEWRQVIDTNLTSAFLCSQAVYPHMVRTGGGKITNIGSILSIFGAPFAVPYGATKGGLVQMARSFATAWAKDNIQVNTILPGWIDTDLTETARAQIEGLNDRVLARTPAKRWGSPDDFAGVAVFLSSSASDFVTGTAIPIDGGYSISG